MGCESAEGPEGLWSVHPRVGRIPWRRAWQPTPVFLPEEYPMDRETGGLQPWGCSQMWAVSSLNSLVQRADWVSWGLSITAKDRIDRVVMVVVLVGMEMVVWVVMMVMMVGMEMVVRVVMVVVMVGMEMVVRMGGGGGGGRV